MKYRAFYAKNALGVYTEDDYGLERLETASKYLMNARFKSFSNLQKAVDYAINGYNEADLYPWQVYVASTLPLNWTVYQKQIEKEYYLKQ